LDIFSEQAIIPFTTGLAHFALLVYLLIKKGIKNRTSNLLLGYLVLTTFWNCFIFTQTSGLTTQYFGRIWHLGFLYPLILMSLGIWGFAQVFLGTEARRLWAFIVGGAVLGMMTVIDFVILPLPTLIVPIKVPNSQTFNLVLDSPNLTFWHGVATISLFLGLAIYSGLKAQAQTYSPRHRNRIQILLVSLAFLITGIGLYLSRAPLLQSIGLIIQWIGAPILIYIVLNQDLPDINRALKELVNFVVIALVTLVFYGAIVYGLQTLLTGTTNAEIVIAVIAAILLTIFYLPLREVTQNLVERLLFRHRYNYEQIIKDYIQAINNILFITDLVSVSLTFIDKNLNIKRGAFFLLNRQDGEYYYFNILSNLGSELPSSVKLKKNTPLTQQLIDKGQSVAQYNLDLFPEFKKADAQRLKALKAMAFEQYVPIKRNHILIGIIALGPFASGAPYSIRDIELFSTLAAQTAISLENARLFENVRQSLEEITRIKDLMDNVFASIKSGVITASTTDEILMVNEAAYTILNLSRDIHPGTHINHLMNYLKNTALPALFRDVKATQRSYHNYEVTSEIKGQGIINLSVDLTPIRNAQKRVEGVAIVINDMTEKNRLQAVQDMFRTYLSPAVVDRLPSDPTQLKLGGQRQEVSILFADIRGFTTFSEFQTPEDLITVLNQYLSIAAQSILIYEGTLDKFMGDAVMAIFNAPLAQADHPLRAVKAAVAMRQQLEEFYRLNGECGPKLQFGVGIHVGEAVVGNVGTHSRMDYTAIGDAVNLAKRIQENTPGGKVLLSQRTYAEVRDHVNATPYKKLTVRGRQEPEQTYELLDLAPDLVPDPVSTSTLT